MAGAAERKVAQAIGRVMAVQRQQYLGGRERFTVWNAKLAKELLEPLAAAVLAGIRSLRGPAKLGEQAAAAIKARSIEVAAGINQTSNDWLEQGRTEEEVFGRDRVARIALTEASHATNLGISLAAQHAKKKVRWVLGGKACTGCKKLAGKVRVPGAMFTIIAGVAVYQPPLHPNCQCKLQLV